MGSCCSCDSNKVELCSIHDTTPMQLIMGGRFEVLRHQSGNNYQLFATVLTDVCYRLYADVIPNPDKTVLPESATSWDRRTTSPGHAYQEMFNRRLKRGQSYATLSLGWGEFTTSYFGPFRETTQVCTDLPDISIPSMLRGVFQSGYNSEYHAVTMSICVFMRVPCLSEKRRLPMINELSKLAEAMEKSRNTGAELAQEIQPIPNIRAKAPCIRILLADGISDGSFICR